jgi:polysaccharide pyruvyl transferase WcaK-like protein
LAKRPNAIFIGISCFCYLSELGGLFRNSVEAFPAHSGYLRVNAGLAHSWQQRLQALGAGLKVGISWRGGAEDATRKARSIPLEYWQLLAIPGVQLINLQYGDHDAEIAAFNSETANTLHCFHELNAMAELDNFAALLSQLDLVISVDNTTVHVAGALNVPTWVVLPLALDWRWLLQRTDSPWYPSLRLFRAEVLSTESMVQQLQRIASELAQRVNSVPHSSANKINAAAYAAPPSVPALSVGYALLLNDTTTWQHWGQACSSLAIHAQLRARYPQVMSLPIRDTNALMPCPTMIEHFDDDNGFGQWSQQNSIIAAMLQTASIVVINGEDTLHGTTHASLALLYMAYVAKTRFKRKVCLINHSCYPDGGRGDTTAPAYAVYKKVYEQLDAIVVRELSSYREVSNMGLPAVQSFDSLPLFIDEQYQRQGKASGQPYIVVAGPVAWDARVIAELGKLFSKLKSDGVAVKLLVGASADLAADDVQFVRALAPLLNADCELCLATSETEWLRVLEQASALVSGRFHHCIAAAFLGTPFVITGSNTPETTGLLSMVELNAFVDSQPQNLAEQLYLRVQQLLAERDSNTLKPERRAELIALARQNFAALDSVG